MLYHVSCKHITPPGFTYVQFESSRCNIAVMITQICKKEVEELEWCECVYCAVRAGWWFSRIGVVRGNQAS